MPSLQEEQNDGCLRREQRGERSQEWKEGQQVPLLALLEHLLLCFWKCSIMSVFFVRLLSSLPLLDGKHFDILYLVSNDAVEFHWKQIQYKRERKEWKHGIRGS